MTNESHPEGYDWVSVCQACFRDTTWHYEGIAPLEPIPVCDFCGKVSTMEEIKEKGSYRLKPVIVEGQGLTLTKPLSLGTDLH